MLKIGTIIFVLLVLYYGIVIFRFRKKKRQIAKPTQTISRRAKNIIGKSTYTGITLASSNQGFKEANQQPLQVDFEMEYDEDENLLGLEAEEMELLTQFDSQTAQGLSFEEMSQAVEAIQQSDINEESERKAVQTITQMQQTDLFELMIKQIDGGRERVAEMLSRVEKENASEYTKQNEYNIDLKGFDLDSYL